MQLRYKSAQFNHRNESPAWDERDLDANGGGWRLPGSAVWAPSRLVLQVDPTGHVTGRPMIRQWLPTNPIIIPLLTGTTPQRPILLIEPDGGDRVVGAVDDFDLVAHAAEFDAIPFVGTQGHL